MAVIAEVAARVHGKEATKSAETKVVKTAPSTPEPATTQTVAPNIPLPKGE